MVLLPSGPTSPPAAETSTCVTSLRFLVTHGMAPLGHLLTYYVRENGEGVTDSLQFAVEPSFENQVLLCKGEWTFCQMLL